MMFTRLGLLLLCCFLLSTAMTIEPAAAVPMTSQPQTSLSTLPVHGNGPSLDHSVRSIKRDSGHKGTLRRILLNAVRVISEDLASQRWNELASGRVRIQLYAFMAKLAPMCRSRKQLRPEYSAASECLYDLNLWAIPRVSEGYGALRYSGYPRDRPLSRAAAARPSHKWGSWSSQIQSEVPVPLMSPTELNKKTFSATSVRPGLSSLWRQARRSGLQENTPFYRMAIFLYQSQLVAAFYLSPDVNDNSAVVVVMQSKSTRHNLNIPSYAQLKLNPLPFSDQSLSSSSPRILSLDDMALEDLARSTSPSPLYDLPVRGQSQSYTFNNFSKSANPSSPVSTVTPTQALPNDYNVFKGAVDDAYGAIRDDDSSSLVDWIDYEPRV